MGSAATEIGLELKLFASRTACSFLKEAADAVDGGVAKLEESVRILVDERKKIEVFKRELPICMFLLTEVIEQLKKELERCLGERFTNGFKEFIPIRSECEEEGADGMKLEADCKEKTHWMSSAQLWSPNSTADEKVDEDGKSVTDEISPRRRRRTFARSPKGTILGPDSCRLRAQRRRRSPQRRRRRLISLFCHPPPSRALLSLSLPRPTTTPTVAPTPSALEEPHRRRAARTLACSCRICRGRRGGAGRRRYTAASSSLSRNSVVLKPLQSRSEN